MERCFQAAQERPHVRVIIRNDVTLEVALAKGATSVCTVDAPPQPKGLEKIKIACPEPAAKTVST